MGCPERWWSHWPWRCSRNIWMLCWGTWFNDNYWWWLDGSTGWSFGSFPTLVILWFYDYFFLSSGRFSQFRSPKGGWHFGGAGSEVTPLPCMYTQIWTHHRPTQGLPSLPEYFSSHMCRNTRQQWSILTKSQVKPRCYFYDRTGIPSTQICLQYNFACLKHLQIIFLQISRKLKITTQDPSGEKQLQRLLFHLLYQKTMKFQKFKVLISETVTTDIWMDSWGNRKHMCDPSHDHILQNHQRALTEKQT